MKIVFCILLVLCFPLRMLSQEIKPEAGKSFSAGTVLNTEAAGIEADFFFNTRIGIRFALIYIYGLGLDEDEYILSGVLALAYNFKTSGIIKPFLFTGPAYSFHHWKSQNHERSGNLHDITIGGGGGLGIKLTDCVLIGLNLWINYDYKTENIDGYKQKGDRFLLFFPFIDVRVLF